jgi:hypothetical protein
MDDERYQLETLQQDKESLELDLQKVREQQEALEIDITESAEQYILLIEKVHPLGLRLEFLYRR